MKRENVLIVTNQNIILWKMELVGIVQGKTITSMMGSVYSVILIKIII